MRQAVNDVFAPEIPFYFKYIVDGSERTHPRLERVEGIVDAEGTKAPQLTVNVPAGCGDWFGNWDGDAVPQGPKYLSDDGTAGHRMAELIARNEPAVMFGHWAGLFSNGSRRGFDHCKKVITTLNATYRDRTIWMKSSEMARYQAARELTRIERVGNQVTAFRRAVRMPGVYAAHHLRAGLAEMNGDASGSVDAAGAGGCDHPKLTVGTWMEEKEGDEIVCFDLAKGRTMVG